MAHVEAIATRFGQFVIETTDLGLRAVCLPGGAMSLQWDPAGTGTSSPAGPAADRHALSAKRELLAYIEGEPIAFETPIDFSGRTRFQIDVLSTLKTVPFGATLSYKELAGLSGYPNACRGVGSVMRLNRTPIAVPCHRVVAAGNKLGGWSGPTGWKEKLLEHEGTILGAGIDAPLLSSNHPCG
jgi:methylated-DNA-[protein]-cysteine S-methyltransferase